MKHMRSRGGGITIYSSLNRFALGGYAIVRRLYTSDMLSPYANLGDEQSQSRLGASGYPTNDVAMQITSQATQQPGKGAMRSGGPALAATGAQGIIGMVVSSGSHNSMHGLESARVMSK